MLVDISENNLVETIRDEEVHRKLCTKLSSYALDVGSGEFDALCRKLSAFNYILNFSALKHVRSESNSFTLSRMIDVNIINAIKLAKLAKYWGAKKYFCVSTDKAANPENMMGQASVLWSYFCWQKVASKALLCEICQRSFFRWFFVRWVQASYRIEPSARRQTMSKDFS